ncbi:MULTISPECIES: PP2C family protein-serine/threonine phosphatase [unclassified Plantactinospora]|uniref:PP2C family protein-serine/threonine phosphatase n=1 Tax=unclassified Plantactinospora TaxID=2631981 RepID=UPI000D1698D0|nr:MULTISPECIES: PP2C family protein-serine/threonine phosphatase [unclassified Plantactinospora]AVT31569.1 serine/threonine-protein phosphatase [Plantactinospora sp. BC1]AVT38763.1 serine/threonine-protein phosphatase [Plantactinospora sp. BB1]
MTGRLAEIRRTLAEAPADLVIERLGAELNRAYGTTETELLQVDYRLAALVPLHGGDPVVGAATPAWRCFDHQTPVLENGTLHLPVTMRGDRLGVLRLTPAPEDPQRHDELAQVATGLAHELVTVRPGTDKYVVGARTRRLTLAAEMQWELLPGRSRIRPSFSLAGQLEPAYAVRGDSFDWADDGQRLWLSTMNGMGEGVSASMLTCLGTNALRNARRAGLELADQAALADQAIYAYHQGIQHLSALLLELDLRTGAVTAVDAGSPRLLVLREGEVLDQPLDDQFPLGMFDGTIYQSQRFQLTPGDRLFVVSDGVLDATSRSGRYGDTALYRSVRRTRSMAPLEAVRSLLGDLRAYVGSDLVDDAVVVCLDWYGG